MGTAALSRVSRRLVRAEFNDWFEAEARCASHPSRTAASTCARCGRFCCDPCLEQVWCGACAPVVRRDQLPLAARSIAWKLLIGPVFLFVSSGLIATKGRSVPLEILPWVVPVLCAVLVLRRNLVWAAWLGALFSLGLLGQQAFSLFLDGAHLRLLDSALLAVAPLLALDGAYRMGRLSARLRLDVR